MGDQTEPLRLAATGRDEYAARLTAERQALEHERAYQKAIVALADGGLSLQAVADLLNKETVFRSGRDRPSRR